ncbi:phosphatase PAP2 family protein [Cohnella fermenti]|uniref:Phosphatase PAP2 family protein n=1 Tax=Cohnella fermenti TaxID=2565925 RepID=A0A4V3WDQ5_9BACL|nr:phosphatase PAP2 family protein [Cohnella fermenti]THF73033.1 phosphatase PAP2 family protein [Cohnella fermenti]
MTQLYRLLDEIEGPLFLHVNKRWNREALNRLFALLTLMGGATFALLSSAAAGIFARGAWSLAGWQALAAVAISHVPVFLAKRSVPRKRPYQVYPQAMTGRRPLKDPSFPSGHTTAGFAMLTPWMLAQPLLIPLLLPLAIGIGLSRVYFGLHFPSDTLAGALLGGSTALLVSLWIV